MDYVHGISVLSSKQSTSTMLESDQGEESPPTKLARVIVDEAVEAPIPSVHYPTSTRLGPSPNGS